MEFERWIRYLIPGYVAMAPLIFAVPFLFNKTQALQTPMLAALVALGPGAGFLVHQIYMVFHEKFYLTNSKRPVIVRIMNGCKKKNTCNHRAAFDITKHEALLAWNYIFYDSGIISKDLRDYMLRSWYFIHSFYSTCWAFCVGFVSLIILRVSACYLEKDMCASSLTILSILIFMYIIGCITFFFKSRLTRKLLEPLEAIVALRHWDKIEEIIVSILQIRDEKQIPPSKAARRK